MQNSYILKLFVAGNDGKTEKLHAGLSEVLQRLTPDKYELEMIDVLVFPDRAKQFEVFATPTLVKASPEPILRVVGKLDNAESAIMAINLINVTGKNTASDAGL